MLPAIFNHPQLSPHSIIPGLIETHPEAKVTPSARMKKGRMGGTGMKKDGRTDRRRNSAIQVLQTANENHVSDEFLAMAAAVGTNRGVRCRGGAP